MSRVAFNPKYTYNPKVNFKQGENDKVLTIPPGPNGPVGSVWIALDKPTYGIHGTPEPSKIGKTESHGCVRLTNWDAQELAKLVRRRDGGVRRSWRDARQLRESGAAARRLMADAMKLQLRGRHQAADRKGARRSDDRDD